MSPTALLLAAILLALAPPVPPTSSAPPAAPTPLDIAAPPPASALSQLSPEARSKAARRAKFVYRLPDGTVWDSWLYCEFRDVLREFDVLSKEAQPSPRLRAWGFKAGSRRIARDDSRPSSLWHTLAPGKHDYTPFIYVNTAHATAADKDRKPMISIEKEVAPRFFQMWVREYPTQALGYLPSTFSSLGVSNCTAFIPAEIRARPGEPLTGEFMLIADPDLERPDTAHPDLPVYRLTHAAKLRLNPEQYAEALLAGEVEMIEWSFRRTSDRLGEKFKWTRRVIEANADATGSDVPEPHTAADPRP